MGRITIFTSEQCVHCRRCKAALDQRHIPYLEISLTLHPEKCSDMLKLCDRMTVPQVFFNDTHIGGADDTMALLEKWDEEELDSNIAPLVRYETEIQALAGPKRLELASPVQEKDPIPPPPPPTTEDKDAAKSRNLSAIELPGGERVSVLEATKLLMEIMPRDNRPWLMRMYKNCFVGTAGVDVIQEHFGLQDREEAVQFGRMLQRHQILHHVVYEHTFGNNWYYFRLQPYQQPNVLNSFRLWTERANPNAMALVQRLRSRLGTILMDVTDDNGFIDYIAAEQHADYIRFEEAVCELQAVNVASMKDDLKLAFSINLYNMMTKHAFIKAGIDPGGAFYRGVLYNVGGDILSLDDVEHGIIRANTRHPYALSQPFAEGDDRKRLALKTLDPRIHFALNCGCNSCPPVYKYTAEAIDEELRIVALAFCEDDANVSMDEERNEISLSMLFSWYGNDFTSTSNKSVPEKVVEYLRSGRKATLERMIYSGDPIVLTYKPYDWGTDASRSITFTSSLLVPNQVSFQALNPFSPKMS